MSNQPTQFNSLEEIANWQLDAKNAKVGLPALQRGYVWKPKQVETLWDSLLRGFPIGSFLVSESGIKRDLLDGQQRATAIAMGFYNPWEESKNLDFFSKKFKDVQKTVPVLWLDLGVKEGIPKGEKGDSIFLPRLVTQSHPWGYNYNGDTLGINIRRNAMEKFDETGHKYPQYDLKDVFPIKAELPVPMNFLIAAIRDFSENWKDKLIENCKEHLFHNNVKIADEVTNYFEKLHEILNDEKTYLNIESAIKNLMQTRIPVISLNKKQLEDESITANADASTLFVRINTAGTGLFGEELIYSMYKTVFPESKDVVEKAGVGFIAPSRIITLISRIALTDILTKSNQEFTFANQLNPKQFKNQIGNEDFSNSIKQFSEGERPYVETLFSNVQILLIGLKDDPKEFQLPFPLAAEMARNPNVFFILLYWLHKSKIDVVKDVLGNESFHKKILAAITTLSWFAIGDINKFLNGVAKQVKESGKLEFWNSKLFIDVQNSEVEENRWITYMPNPEELEEILIKKFNTNWNDIPLPINKPQFDKFRDKLYWQRGLLLFVQRTYIKTKFKELQWDTILEDTNRPWDWDHIYPSVYYQKGTHDEIKELNYTNGNLRALALEDNRSDQAKLPKDKFKYKGQDKDTITEKEIIEKEELIRYQSFIKEDKKFWEKIDSERITTNEEKAKNVCLAIYTRLSNIYKEWYTSLEVGKLFDLENISTK